MYLVLSRSTILLPPTVTIDIENEPETNRTRPIAFIISENCKSQRFNATKKNIRRALPNFFNILCFPAIPLNDSRVHPINDAVVKKLSSNLLAFIQIWTYEIPKRSKNQLDWTFIFEDDVNFIDTPKPALSNLTGPLRKMMNNPEIQIKDGFMYLGICGPTYSNASQPILLKNRKEPVISRKGSGYCLHATAITAARSKLFWTQISSYFPNVGDRSLDYQLRQYSLRSGTFFYTLGTNYEFPPGTGHFGIAYQDRGVYRSTVSEPIE